MIELVKNEPKYWEFLRTLRNHIEVRPGFIRQDYIETEDHARFMEKYGECFYICLVDNEAAGFVGVIDKDIRVATSPDYQQRGLGKFMIQQLLVMHPDSVAKVKVENEASLRLFESCVFTRKYYILEKAEETE
jgi:ribosomal protein S18 acetylase RimI-like enzyme